MKSIEVYVEFRGHSKIDFDQKAVRKVIGQQAREVRKVARRLVSRRAISKAGEMPGRASGALMRSIKVIMLKRSMAAMVMPTKSSEMEVFYPGMLHKGTKSRLKRLAAGEGRGKSNRRKRGARVNAQEERKASGTYIMEPRANYMQAALTQRRETARDAIYQALKSSLVPRKLP